MAGNRTLKLSILGDVDNLNKSLKTAGGDVDSFGDKVGKAGKKIGGAFVAAGAAAGAAAIAIGIEGVKAAIADEKAQTQLALALENATGATTAQIKATEQSILQMSLATGVADDELRPALGRLVRSTGDTTKAQDLLATALDIAAATGKPVEAVANSLAKAYDGNTTALGKLGIGLDAAELKSMSFEQVQGRLTDLFGGAAAANANTYAGQIARVKVAFGEAQEAVGTALLPILGKLLDFINTSALPAINAFSGAFSLTQGDGFGKVLTDVAKVIRDVAAPIFDAMKAQFDKIKQVIIDNKDNFKAFFDVVKFFAPIIGTVIGGAVRVIGDIAEVVLSIISRVLGAIKPLLNTAIDGINAIIKAYNQVTPGKDFDLIKKIGAASTSTGALGNFSMSTGSVNAAIGITGTGTGNSASTGGGTTGTGTGTGSSTGGGVASIAATATKAAEVIAQSITDQVSGLSDIAGARFFEETGGQLRIAVPESFDLARVRRGEESDRSTTINLTVNGAIDKEGTARTIVDTLNNSFYRGTGGATNLQIA